ncbi:MAG: photosynthetic complex assembly protein PuhC [Pseudomonadota bacterium]
MTRPDTQTQRADLPQKFIAAFMLFALVSVMLWTPPPPTEVSDDGVVGFRALTFADGPNGQVVVRDAYSGEPVDTLGTGHGFLRATVRSLARLRVDAGHPPEAPFHLREYQSGQLLLIDPTTNEVIDLWAFGEPNLAAFAKYVQPGKPPARQGRNPAWSGG